MVHPYFDPALTPTFIDAGPRKDSTFELRYFSAHGLCSTIRAALAVSGANWKDTSSDDWDWATEKPKQPFGVMPILTETTADGKVLRVVESDAIEHYLGRKYGLLGDNLFEEVLIKTFLGSSVELSGKFYTAYGALTDPTAKATALEKLLSTSVADWIRYHEEHLRGNGTNGHYVGQKVSLADIKAYQITRNIINVSGDEIVSEKKTPALWKVRQTLEAIPTYAAWVNSDKYKAQGEYNFKVVGY